MSIDHRAPEIHVTAPDEVETGIDRKATKKKLGRGVIAGLTAGALGLMASVVYGLMPKGDAVNAIPSPSATVATGPATPGFQESTPVPTASETIPETPKLPFDAEAALQLRSASVKEFYERPREEQINYYLEAAYVEDTTTGEFADKLNHVLISGFEAYEYNPFGAANASSREADPQAILDFELYNEGYLMAHTDPAQAEKLVSGIVLDQNSKAAERLRKFAREHAEGVQMGQATATDKDFFEVTGSKETTVLDKQTGEELPGMIIETKKTRYSFAFYKVPGLSDIDANTSNDGKEAGLWLVVSWTAL